ncbi:hypothetical protein HY627_01020 [Candidatus Uhrbacteria bacterium]|nr:hypothetical protein [Candidatus Uhrbacteria bacterium]
MRFFLYAALVLFVSIVHLTLLPFGDLPLAVILAVLFFVGPAPALAISFMFGFFSDLYSPIFGIHLIAYPVISVMASKLYSAFLTDQSVFSFSALSFFAFIALWMFTGVSGFVGLAETFRVFFLGLCTQAVFTFFLYGVCSFFSRTFSHGYAQ